MASQKMQTEHFNLLCQIAHFISSWETLYLARGSGRFFFPWILKGEGTRGRIRQRAVQKQCAAWLAFEVAPTKCCTLEVSVVSLQCVSTFHGAPAQEEILAWASRKTMTFCLGAKPSVLYCVQPVIFLLLVYLLVLVIHACKESWTD